jgi:hypothetical protein
MALEKERENILNKIRQALVNPVPLPFPLSEEAGSVYQPVTDELDIIFAETFTQLQGKFIFCMDEKDMQTQLEQLIKVKEWMKIFCYHRLRIPGCKNGHNCNECRTAKWPYRKRIYTHSYLHCVHQPVSI